MDDADYNRLADLHEGLVAQVDRLARSLLPPPEYRMPRAVDDYRPCDALGRHLPRNPFQDPALLMRAIPGLAAQFRRRVPEQYITSEGVTCVCGEYTPVPPAEFVQCGCDRYFLRANDVVYCARFPTPKDEEAA